jgi:hypothetical protein
MLEGQKMFIHTHETFFAIGTRFRHLNFNIKGGIVHSILPLLKKYYYAIEICTKFVVEMKGNIGKEVVERMKRRESSKSKPKGSQISLKIDCGEKKKEKMGSDFFGKGKIIFSDMDKF